MWNPINRTTVQTGENKYRLYSKGAPLFYKNPEGELNEIDHTFNDTSSTIGDISLMNKGVVSVGKRKGSNPYKAVGIRPDNCQNGEKQLEFSLVNIELDDEEQEFNIETDLELKLTASNVYQLVKLNKNFGKCKIEFDIYVKGLELLNEKIENDTVICDYSFSLKNLGEIEGGITDITLDNMFSENKDIPYIDGHVFKITNDYITTGEYSNEEEFGNSNLNDYIINNNLYEYGSGMYYKDCLIFVAKVHNIEDFENIIAENIADIYECSLLKNDENHSEEEYMDGYYFIKDGKKIGGYFSQDNIFYAFFNTKEIPNNIKELFERKNFDSTSYIDLSLNDFYIAINNRFNKNLTINIDSNYYNVIDDKFQFKINKESFYIDLPIAFDENREMLNYDTTHTLTDNEDGSYRYTKWLLPQSALRVNNAKYLDATLNVSQSVEGGFGQEYTTTFGAGITKTAANLELARDQGSGNKRETASGNDTRHRGIGDWVDRTTVSGKSGTTTTNKWQYFQTNYRFDSSGITGDVDSLALKFKASAIDQRNYGTTPDHEDCTIIASKSIWDGTNSLSGASYPQYNEFIWGSGSFNTTSGDTWDSSDDTQYSSTLDIAHHLTTITDYSLSLNSTAKTDIRDNSTFIIMLNEYDQYYQNTLDTSYPDRTVNGSKGRYVNLYEYNASTVANRPYIEYTLAGVSEVTYDANFFGANF